MDNEDKLRISDESFASALNCGPNYNGLVQHILEDYLPHDILNDYLGKLFFVGTKQRDACRVPSIEVEGRDIIVLSERIFPRIKKIEDGEFRCFVFTILHEIAHVVKNHKSPRHLSNEIYKVQEEEADEIAKGWFEKHVQEVNSRMTEEYKIKSNRDIKPLTDKEIKKCKEVNKKKMND